MPTTVPTARDVASWPICKAQYQSSRRWERDSNVNCPVNQNRLRAPNRSRRSLTVGLHLVDLSAASARNPATRFPRGPPASAITDHLEQRKTIDVKRAM